jgi:hypothetical protein
MGYYIRALGVRDIDVPFAELISCLSSHAGVELKVEAETDGRWSQLLLQHKTSQEIALIERNPVSPGTLGQEEILEFIEEVRDAKPSSAARWLERYFTKVKVIYAFQILNAVYEPDGWSAVFKVQDCIREKCGGIIQADLEGFYNEEGYQILWQFVRDKEGEWNMAVLDEKEVWTPFEMRLEDAEQKAAFLDGKVPPRAKLL